MANSDAPAMRPSMREAKPSIRCSILDQPYR
jgi:hypothetical protein